MAGVAVTDKADKKIQVYRYLFYCLCCVLFACRIFRTGGDLHFILATGRYIEANGIFYEDVFSMHEGLAFQAEQWLFALWAWKVYAAAGLFGLSVFVTACFCLTAVLFDKLYRMYGGTADYPVLIVLLFIGRIYARARPQCVSMALFLSFLYGMERARDEKRWYAVCLLCSAAVANLHGALWFVLPCVWVCFAIEYHKDGKEYMLLLAGLVLAGCLNPYGAGMLGFLDGAAPDNIYWRLAGEMAHASVFFKGYFNLIGFVLIGSLVPFTMVFKKMELRHRLLFAGFWLCGAFAFRGTLLLVLLGYPAMLSRFHWKEKPDGYIWVFPALGVYYLYASGRPAQWNVVFYVFAAYAAWKSWPSRYRWAAVLAACMVLFARPVSVSQERDVLDKVERHGPWAVQESLLREDNLLAPQPFTAYMPKKGGTVYTRDFSQGAMFIFEGYRPYIDARLELYFKGKNKKEDIIGELLGIRDGKLYFPDIVEKYKFDYILIYENDVGSAYMRDVAGYRKVYADGCRNIYERVPEEKISTE